MSSVTLMIMTKKGYTFLQSLIENNCRKAIDCVIIGQDKNTLNDYYEEISSLCIKYHIPHLNRFDKSHYKSQFIVAVSWRWLIQCEGSKLIVFHDSILPKYRGFAPLVNMLINGEPELGVTVLYGNENYDDGEIILQKKIKIEYPIKISRAIDLISNLYGQLGVDLFRMINKSIKPISTPQDPSKISYSLWLNESDYHINWNESSEQILRFINSVSFPYKGAYSYLNEKEKIRILDAEIYEDVTIENRSPGKVIFNIDGCPVIVCGFGLLLVTKAAFDETSMDALPFSNFRIKLS